MGSDFINISIRKGNEQDAAGVVEVNTYTWLTTYKGLMPDEILENRVKTMDERVSKIASSIRERDNLYVAVYNDKIVGIMTYGQSRNDNYSDCGEIYSIYVLESYQGLGLGKKLFMIGLKELIDNGFNSMILNVLDGNKAIYFYEKFGGVKVGARQDDFDGTRLTENIMYFDNLKKIYLDFNAR